MLKIDNSKFQTIAIAGLIFFSVLARGAHDIWAATLVYIGVLLLCLIYVIIVACNESSPEIHLPLFLPSLLIVGVLYLSFRQSINSSESFLGFMDWLISFLLFYVCVNVFREKDNLNFLLVLIVPVFLAEYSVTVYQRLANNYLLKLALTTWKEPTGTFVNGNSLVAFELIWIPILIRRFMERSGRCPSRQWYWACGLVTLLLSLLLVASTWSLVCLSLGFLMMVGRKRLETFFTRYRILSRVILTVGVATLLCLIWYKLALIYGWSGVKPHRITTSRLDWWIGGIRMWKDHPWLGVGIGNFPSAYLAYKTGTGHNTLYAHSFLIQILTETGIVGFISFLLFFINWVFAVSRTVTFDRKPLAIGLFMFLLFSAMHVSLEYLSNLLACALFLGVLIAPSTEGLKWKPRRSAAILAFGLVVCAIPFVISPIFASRFIVDGEDYLRQSNIIAAEKSFQSAIELDQRPWEPYAGLARISFERKNISQAILFQEEAIKRNKLDLRLNQTLKFYQRFLS